MYIKVASRSGENFLKQKFADYAMLLKVRLSLLVVFSSVMAYLIAASGLINWMEVFLLGVGGFMVTGAANTFNQVLERESDQLMTRTANRPIATGRLSVSEAVLFAGFMSLFGILILATFNPWTALLGMISLILYAFVYTPLKKISSVAVIVGAIPGALPMMIGCVAFEGEITMLALTLFAVQFLWQFPHFWAIAWMAFEDYMKAGIHLLPSKRGVRDNNSGLQSFIYAMFLIPVSLVPYMMGVSGMVSGLILLICGLAYAWCGWDFYRKETRKTALRLMFSSFFYLPIILFALFFDKI
ncbi:MAG: protoheme IX farnesyltransferase [Saprospiraceae bacterium]